MTTVSKLNEDSSIRIPEDILEKPRLKPGAELIWLYDKHGQIILMEKPESFEKL